MIKNIKVTKKLQAYKTGKQAELYTCKYLENQKWSILHTNYKTPYGEIDIIAKKNNLIVAFEVKYRKDINIL